MSGNPKLFTYRMSNGVPTGHPGDVAPQTDITLRDLFAAVALNGSLASTAPEERGRWGIESYARDAYALADAMLAERSK